MRERKTPSLEFIEAEDGIAVVQPQVRNSAALAVMIRAADLLSDDNLTTVHS